MDNNIHNDGFEFIHLVEKANRLHNLLYVLKQGYYFLCFN